MRAFLVREHLSWVNSQYLPSFKSTQMKEGSMSETSKKAVLKQASLRVIIQMRQLQQIILSEYSRKLLGNLTGTELE